MEQVITNSYQVSKKEYSANYRLKGDSEKSELDKLVSLIAKSIFLSVIPAAIANIVSSDFFFLLIALAIALPLLLIGYSIYKNNSTAYSYRHFGYSPQPMFAMIKADVIEFIYEDKATDTIHKETISYARKTKDAFVIFHGEEQMHYIPLDAFASDEDKKFFTSNYFVHYI